MLQEKTSEFKNLMKAFGNPQDKFKTIHVAGTNGKGSTSAMLAWVLSCSGYKTGLFTSPHLDKPNERIKINGIDIADEDYLQLKTELETKAAELGVELGFFEEFTAIGFLYFERKKVDIAVIEVGLGGRLDATNIIAKPELCAITTIDLDHTEILGDTIEKIAAEKAGIFKPGTSVVCLAQSKGAENVFKQKAKELGCPIRFTQEKGARLIKSSLDYQLIEYKNRPELKLKLLGNYQLKNAALVVDCLDYLKEKGLDITEEAIKKGFAEVCWPGRFEVLCKEPAFIVDGAHNPNGVSELTSCLSQYFPGKKIDFIMGVLADKDYSKMLYLIAPFAKSFTLVTPPSKRALPAETLAHLIQTRYSLPVQVCGSVEEGVYSAIKKQREGEVCCAFGSLYQVNLVRSAAQKFFKS